MSVALRTALFWGLSVCWLVGQDVRVVEVVASNGSLLDEDGDSPDWVEVRNVGDVTVDLEGYRLAAQDPESSQWTFPTWEVEAGEAVVVFASGKDRADGGELHTDFRLSSLGGRVWISEAGKSLGSGLSAALEWPRLNEDESFGRDPGGKEAYFSAPSPGAVNGPGEIAGPRFTNSQPVSPPRDGGAVRIQFQLVPRDVPIASATLHFTVDGGAEQQVPLEPYNNAAWHDAVIPGEQVKAGGLLRWWATAVDEDGVVSRLPAGRSPGDSAVTFGAPVQQPELEGGLRDLHWEMDDPALADTDEGGRGSLYFDNIFYDNVRFERHGVSSFDVPSPGGVQKLSHDIEFTREQLFRHLTFEGGSGEPLTRRAQLLSHWRDKTKLRALIGYEIFAEAGHPALRVTPVRVQRNGEFYGLFDLVEEPNEVFLRRVGLPEDGALYEITAELGAEGDVVEGAYDKKTREDEGAEPLAALIGAIDGGGTAAAFDALDVPSVVNYLAAIAVVDTAEYGDENLLFFHDQEGSGRWSVLPWDLDMGFGRVETEGGVFNDLSDPGRLPMSYRGSNAVLDAFRDDPVLRSMVWRRFERLGVQFFDGWWLEERLQAWVTTFGQDAVLDFEKWGSWGDGFGMADAVALLETQYLVPRRDLVLGGFTEMPVPQPEQPALEFGNYEVSPVSGDQDQEWLEIRNRETVAVDLSGFRLSRGVTFEFPAGTVLPAGGELLVVPDLEAFGEREVSPMLGEGRYVVGGYDGHLSNHGEEIQLRNVGGAVLDTVEVSGPLSDVQRYLVVSEIMYEFSDKDDGEFIELLNTSQDVVLDLRGVRITEGVSYAFANGLVPALGPGERVLVVRDAAGFERRYGSEVMLKVAGEFEDGTALKNSGERIKIEDALGNTVVNFRYDNRDEPWPRGTGGGDRSLVLIEPGPEAPHDDGRDWTSSVVPWGNPGGPDWVPSVASPIVDSDGDGANARVEAVLGTSDEDAGDIGAAFEVGTEIVPMGDVSFEFFTVTHPVVPTMAGLSVQVQSKPDLTRRIWLGDPVLLRREARADGRVWLTWRSREPVDVEPEMYFGLSTGVVGRNRDRGDGD